MSGEEDLGVVREYIGLDIAHNMGVAIYHPLEHIAVVAEVKGSPIEQYIYISKYILNKNISLAIDITFVLEELVHFRNANTTRSLLERKGYIKYSLLELQQEIKEVTPGVARITFGMHKKSQIKDFFMPCNHCKRALTDNHTDALAVAVHQSMEDGYKFSRDNLCIWDYEPRGE